MRSKVVSSALEAIAELKPGMHVMFGGFAPTMSLPVSLLSAMVEHGAGDLTVIGCTIGYGRLGPQMLAEAGLVKKFIGSAATQVARPTVFEDKILAGEIEIEMVPQGTLAERMRAAGAGLAAFYTLTGAGTALEENREVREFDGRTYLLEPAAAGRLRAPLGQRGGRSRKLPFRRNDAQFPDRDGDGGGDRGGGNREDCSGGRDRPRGCASARHLHRSRRTGGGALRRAPCSGAHPAPGCLGQDRLRYRVGSGSDGIAHRQADRGPRLREPRHRSPGARRSLA